MSGRSLPDVVQLLGQPDQELSHGREHLRLTYWFGRKGNLKIDFRDGFVSGIAHDAWSTGVEEADVEKSAGP